MKEKGNENPDLPEARRVRIKVPERRLVHVYRREKENLREQQGKVETYKTAIIERKAELAEMYHDFVESLFAEDTVTPYMIPVKDGSKSKTNRLHLINYQPKTLSIGEGDDKKAISVSYKKNTMGESGPVVSENIVINYPGIKLVISLRKMDEEEAQHFGFSNDSGNSSNKLSNDKAIYFEMDDANTIQTIGIDGEPRIVTIGKPGVKQEESDILDAYKDIFVELKKAEVEPVNLPTSQD